MNNLLWRTALILVHAVVNFFVVTFLLDYDITGSWLRLTGFILLILFLLFLFIKHLVSYIYFIKPKIK